MKDLDEKLQSISLPVEMDFTQPYTLSEMDKERIVLHYIDRWGNPQFQQYRVTNISGFYVATPVQGALLKK